MAQFFEWVSTQFYKTLIYDKRYMMYLEGLLDTIIISLGAIVLGLVIGILFATIKYINKRNGKLKVLTKIINFVIRGGFSEFISCNIRAS